MLRALLPTEFYRVLRKSSFLYFALSVFLSQVAFQLMNISLIFIVFYLTSSTLAVSLLVLSILLPQILFSFLGGVVADIRSKKRILIYGNILRAILILVLFFQTSSLAVIFIVSVLVSTITQFYVPAEPPLIPQLVGKRKLVAANSLFGISLFSSILVAFVIAGPFIQIFGRNNVYIFISALFAVSAMFAFFLPDRKKPGPESSDSLIVTIVRYYHEEFKSSARLLRGTKDVGSSFFLLIFSQVVIWVLATVVPDYAENVLMVDAENLSLILFAPAALGMLIASTLFGGKLSRASKRSVATIGVFISGFSLLFFPLTPYVSNLFFDVGAVAVAVIIAFMAGFANAFIFVPSQAIIQDATPENFRSKIYGLLFAVVGLVSLFPILLAGGVADVFGVGIVLSLLGFVILLVGIFRLRYFIR